MTMVLVAMAACASVYFRLPGSLFERGIMNGMAAASLFTLAFRFQWWCSFFRRWRKYSKLSALSRKRRHFPVTVEELLRDSSDRDLEELCSIVLNDKDCLAVLSRFNGSAETLRELEGDLIKAGAGQWAGQQWIPYMALAEPWTLEYLLLRRSQSASLLGTASRIVIFYQHKKPLAWLQWDSEGAEDH